MNEVALNIPSAKWHTCVSTIKCDVINEHVSIMVKNDWTSHCTWYKQFKDPSSGSPMRIKPDKKNRRKIELCQGPLCSYVSSYRDKLIKEEQHVSGGMESAIGSQHSMS
jgi:hypothetical protein